MGIYRVYVNAPRTQRNQYMNAGLLVQSGMLFGARAVFVLLHWGYFSEHPEKILRFYEGGLSFAGVVLGGLIGLLLVILLSHQSPLKTIDGISPMLPPLGISAWIAAWTAQVNAVEMVQINLLTDLLPPNQWDMPSAVPHQLVAAICLLLPLAWLEIRQPFRGVDGLLGSLTLMVVALDLLYFTSNFNQPEPAWNGFSLDLYATRFLLLLSIILFFTAVRQELAHHKIEDEIKP